MSYPTKSYFLIFITILLTFQLTIAWAKNCDWYNRNWNRTTTRPASFILAMGVENKNDDLTNDLTLANEDAQRWATAMQTHFEVPKPHYVCVLENVTQGQFIEALRRLQKLVRQTDKVFIYFSGHGTYLEDKEKRERDCHDEAFVTYYKRDPAAESIRDDTFVKEVNKIGTNQIITFLDTCFASSLRRSKKCSVINKLLTNRKAGQGFLSYSFRGVECSGTGKHLHELKGILYAASKEKQLAFEIPKKGGYFTITFIDMLEKYSHKTLDEIFNLTARKVATETKGTYCVQQPQRCDTRFKNQCR